MTDLIYVYFSTLPHFYKYYKFWKENSKSLQWSTRDFEAMQTPASNYEVKCSFVVADFFLIVQNAAKYRFCKVDKVLSFFLFNLSHLKIILIIGKMPNNNRLLNHFWSSSFGPHENPILRGTFKYSWFVLSNVQRYHLVWVSAKLWLAPSIGIYEFKKIVRKKTLSLRWSTYLHHWSRICSVGCLNGVFLLQSMNKSIHLL